MDASRRCCGRGHEVHKNIAQGLVDFIRRVDDLAHAGRERKEGNHTIPGVAPRGTDRREFLTPRTLSKHVEFGLSRFRAGGRVNRLDRSSQATTILPTGVVQAVADQVDDAGLQGGRREHRRQRFGQTLEAVGDGDQDVAHTTGLQIVEHLHPELGTFGALDPQPQDVAGAIGQDAQRQVDGLVATTASSRILTRSASKNTTGYMGSSGLACRAVTSPSLRRSPS